MADLNAREIAALAPLLSLCLILGLFQPLLLNLIRPDVEQIARIYGNAAPLSKQTVAMEIPATTLPKRGSRLGDSPVQTKRTVQPGGECTAFPPIFPDAVLLAGVCVIFFKRHSWLMSEAARPLD